VNRSNTHPAFQPDLVESSTTGYLPAFALSAGESETNVALVQRRPSERRARSHSSPVDASFDARTATNQALALSLARRVSGLDKVATDD
jgi:hypothetical protein